MTKVLSINSNRSPENSIVLKHKKNIKSKHLGSASFKTFYILILTVLCFSTSFLALPFAQAAGVTLTWQRNQEPDIAGYKIFYGTQSGQYTNSITIDDTATRPLERSYSVDGLQEGATYYFAIKAFDLAGQEGLFSDEVSKTIPVSTVISNPAGTSSGPWYTTQNWLEVDSVNIDHNWKKVTLTRQFQDPVVIVGPPTSNDSQPCTVRLRNVTSNSFEIRIQEWNYLDQAHATEDVSYMVVEAGTYLLPDGTIWEAGTYDLSGTNQWQQVMLSGSFTGTPLVFQTVQTFNDSDAIIIREKGVTASGFSGALQEEEALNDGHGMEIVGYIMVENGSSADVLIKNLTCTDKFTDVDSSLSEQIKMEEEQSADSETVHANENIGILALGNHVFAQIQTFSGSDTVGLRLHDNTKNNAQTATSSTDSFVSRLYEKILGRTPDNAGFNYWTNLISTGSLDPTTVARNFIFSAEFLQKNTTNEEFVSMLYRGLLGREPDASGFNSWVNALDFGIIDRMTTAQSFLNSYEFRILCNKIIIEHTNANTQTEGVTGFVSRLYTQILSRNPDSSGLTHWVHSLTAGTQTADTIVMQFVFSPEFLQKNVTDDEFVSILYRGLLGREPDASGFNSWVVGLKSYRINRMSVVQSFVNSKEFENLCKQYGISIR